MPNKDFKAALAEVLGWLQQDYLDDPEVEITAFRSEVSQFHDGTHVPAIALEVEAGGKVSLTFEWRRRDRTLEGWLEW